MWNKKHLMHYFSSTTYVLIMYSIYVHCIDNIEYTPALLCSINPGEHESVVISTLRPLSRFFVSNDLLEIS